MRTKQIFCANCQLVTLHNAEVDGNGEYIFTCQTPTSEDTICGRIIKLPADTTKEQADELFTKHEEVNVGQMNAEAQAKKLDEILGEEELED